MIKKYRQPDQYYIDWYDRETIERMKELEMEEAKQLASVIEEERWKVYAGFEATRHSFKNTGILRARAKTKIINALIQQDEEKDRLVQMNSVPQKITCTQCGNTMICGSHLFRKGRERILFIFDCPKTCRRVLLYPNGKPFRLPERKCSNCDGKLTTVSKKRNGVLITTDTCRDCKKSSVLEFDLSPPDETAINEKDRIKYCSSFRETSTFFEDWESAYNCFEAIEKSKQEKQQREIIGIDKIKILTVSQLERLLVDATLKECFTKFTLDKPEIGKDITVSFIVQAPPSLDESKSLLTFKKLMKEQLLTTNWRLMAEGISCRLGVLSGSFKGYEKENDLIKIAREIETKNSRI